MLTELMSHSSWQHVCVIELSSSRARDRSVGTDQAKLKAKLLGYWHGKPVPASCDQNDVNTSQLGTTESFEIGRGDVQRGIDESAIDINSNQANGERH